MPLWDKPPRRLIEALKRLAKDRRDGGLDDVSRERVQATTGSGAAVVRNQIVPVAGSAQLRAGEEVFVANVQGRPTAVIAHSARRAEYPQQPVPAGPIVEELFIASTVEGAFEPRDVFFRNEQQITALGVDEILQGLGFAPNSSNMQRVRWGKSKRAFMVVGSVSGTTRVWVFRLSGRPDQPFGTRKPSVEFLYEYNLTLDDTALGTISIFHPISTDGVTDTLGTDVFTWRPNTLLTVLPFPGLIGANRLRASVDASTPLALHGWLNDDDELIYPITMRISALGTTEVNPATGTRARRTIQMADTVLYNASTKTVLLSTFANPGLLGQVGVPDLFGLETEDFQNIPSDFPNGQTAKFYRGARTILGREDSDPADPDVAIVTATIFNNAAKTTGVDPSDTIRSLRQTFGVARSNGDGFNIVPAATAGPPAPADGIVIDVDQTTTVVSHNEGWLMWLGNAIPTSDQDARKVRLTSLVRKDTAEIATRTDQPVFKELVPLLVERSLMYAPREELTRNFFVAFVTAGVVVLAPATTTFRHLSTLDRLAQIKKPLTAPQAAFADIRSFAPGAFIQDFSIWFNFVSFQAIPAGTAATQVRALR